MVRVGIVGATGYTALELIRILIRHPQVEITALSTRQEDAPHISEVHPSLHGRLDLRCENLSPAQLAERCDFAFSALPHAASMAAVPQLLSGGCRVVDLSADYRLREPSVYEKWYGHVHTDPTRLGSTAYGLPELFGEKIVESDLVANPGCYPTTAILGLAPLLCEGLVEPKGIVVDAKSGVSGAGRSPKLTTLFCEANESVAPYSVGSHRHTPEIDQILADVSSHKVEVVFTPHLMPMDRGLLCTMYPRLTQQKTEEELMDVIRGFYAGKPFIRVVEHIPSTKATSGTNFCDITVRVTRGQLIVISCLDNLVKGASGAAVQNFNLMYGFDETTALLP